MRRIIFSLLGFTGIAIFLAACLEHKPSGDETRFLRGDKIIADCIAAKCETLNLDSAFIRDLPALNSFDHVKILMVSYTNFDSLDHISNLTSLEELHIRNSKVTSLAGLWRFQNLRVLHVSEVETNADQAEVAKLKNLRELAFSSGNATQIEFVGALRNLRKLHIFGSKIESFAPLRKLRKVQSLEISNNQVLDIRPILAMPKLKVITLDSYTDEQMKQLEKKGVQVVQYAIVC